MCKDEWNCLNGDYEKSFDYHKGACHNTSYQDLFIEKYDKLHLLKQFNEDYYNVI